jgi:hypothetical protein
MTIEINDPGGQSYRADGGEEAKQAVAAEQGAHLTTVSVPFMNA